MEKPQEHAKNVNVFDSIYTVQHILMLICDLKKSSAHFQFC